jgi:hypothetical protein
MFNHPNIKWFFLLLCFISGRVTMSSEPNDPNAYIPICKAPKNFYLKEAVVSKIEKGESTTNTWSFDKNKKALTKKKTEKSSIKDSSKYPDRFKEMWIKDNEPNNKSKDEIDLLKLVCPDKGTLDKSIEQLLKLYSIKPDEIKQPSFGDRLWKYETKQSTLLECCKGLEFLRVDIFSLSLSSSERLKLAEDIIKVNLKVQKTNESAKTTNATDPNK